MLGVINRVSTKPIGGYGFTGETSGWSESQTISIPENTSLNPMPTSPKPLPSEEPQQLGQEVILGLAVTVAVVCIGLGLLVYLIRSKR